MKSNEPEFRCPTRTAIDSLAKRFNLRNQPGMQDWVYEVADPNRIDEFIAAYESDELTDDEKFALMEIIIQSFEELESPLSIEPRWNKIVNILRNNSQIHAYTIWYWMALEIDNEKDRWRVSPYMIEIFDEDKGIIG